MLGLIQEVSCHHILNKLNTINQMFGSHNDGNNNDEAIKHNPISIMPEPLKSVKRGRRRFKFLKNIRPF